MGSIGLYRERGISDRDFYAREYGWDKPDSKREIVASHSTSGTFYAAVRDKATGQVWALVSDKRWDRNGYFTYRLDDETVGPGSVDCPARILDLLTPTDSQWANEWRQACRNRIAEVAAAKAERKALRAGDRVRFEGSSEDGVFVLRESRKGLLAWPDGTGPASGYRPTRGPYKLPAVTSRVKVRKVEAAA